MAALPRSSYRYKSNNGNNVRMSRVSFPDRIQEAQVMFRTKPEDLFETQNAKEKFLQSIADYENMRSGIDYSNQRLFQSINNKLSDTSLKNVLPFSGNEIEDKKRMDKLKDLLKNVMDSQQLGPALIQFLQTPEVQALVDKTKSGLQTLIKSHDEAVDTRIHNAIAPLQTQLSSVVGTPVRVPMSYLVDMFKTADLKELPLFEISMDPAGPEKGLLGIFKELESKSYFELLPANETEFKTSLNVVNDRQQEMEIPLTEEFCDLLTKNKITDHVEAKNMFYALYNHTIKGDVDNVFSQFKSGQVEGYPNITDKHAIEENKRQAAELITDWAKKSIKFREWISKSQSGDIVSDATKFLEDLDKKAEPVPETSVFETSVPETPRRNLRSDTRKQEQLEKSAFKTPAPKVTVEEKYELTPKGKEMVQTGLQAGAGTREELEQKLINFALQDPIKYKGCIVKKGANLDLPKPEVKTVVIPPSKLERLDRIKVILGNIEADNTADYLDEYSAIADALLKDKMITKDQHKFLVNKYTTLLDL